MGIVCVRVFLHHFWVTRSIYVSPRQKAERVLCPFFWLLVK
jgi:hypothetical protein